MLNHWVTGVIAQNVSVLYRMPNDCTAHHNVSSDVQSPWQGYPIHMPKTKNARKQTKVPPAPKRRKQRRPNQSLSSLGKVLVRGGNAVGNYLTAGVFPKILGSGAYTMRQNTMAMQPQVPSMHNATETITVRHREYLLDIFSNANTAGAYTQSIFPINPGAPGSFDWLSGLATGFQEYHFTGLVFEFVSNSATAIASGTNTTMGTVMMAFDYTSTGVGFTSKPQLLNEMWSVDGMITDNLLLPIECAPSERTQGQYYVRGPQNNVATYPPTGGAGGAATIFDPREYDIGQLIVASSGVQGTSVQLGEIWVTYEVVLSKPRMSAALGFAIPGLHLRNLVVTPNQNNPLIALNNSQGNLQATTTGFNNTAFYPISSIGNPGITIYGSNNISFFGLQGFFTIFIKWGGPNTTGAIVFPTFGTNANAKILVLDVAPGAFVGNLAIVELVVFVYDASQVGLVTLTNVGTNLPLGTSEILISQIAYSTEFYSN